MRLEFNNNCGTTGICGHFTISLSSICQRWDEFTKFGKNEKDIEILLNSCFFEGKAFDYVFEQNRSPLPENKIITATNHQNSGIYVNKHFLRFSGKRIPIEKVPEILGPRLKVILGKLKFKNELVERSNKFVESCFLNYKILGVHIRLTDMNYWHGNDYGYANFDDYVRSIEKIQHDYDKIYVSSDNYESIEKLKQKYPDKVINLKVPNLFNSQEEVTTKPLKRLIKTDPSLWFDLFTELLILSKCNYLIGRTSSVTLAALLLSEDLKLFENHHLCTDSAHWIDNEAKIK